VTGSRGASSAVDASRTAAPAKIVLRIAAPQPEPVGLPAAASVPVPHEQAATPAAHTSRDRAGRGRIHVVRPNESLWSIARDLLGENASTARIAREVNRLWELNSTRIGTGDPDLLMAGTRLRVR
jgi:Tfp pilus assembly protein FimV